MGKCQFTSKIWNNNLHIVICKKIYPYLTKEEFSERETWLDSFQQNCLLVNRRVASVICNTKKGIYSVCIVYYLYYLDPFFLMEYLENTFSLF